MMAEKISIEVVKNGPSIQVIVKKTNNSKPKCFTQHDLDKNIFQYCFNTTILASRNITKKEFEKMFSINAV